jgi:hypothetical protein
MGELKNWFVKDGELYTRYVEINGKREDRSTFFFGIQLLTDKQAIEMFPHFRDGIESREWKIKRDEIIKCRTKGDSYREIEKKLEVSPNTVQRAIDEQIAEYHDIFELADDEIMEALHIDEKRYKQGLERHKCKKIQE